MKPSALSCSLQRAERVKKHVKEIVAEQNQLLMPAEAENDIAGNSVESVKLDTNRGYK